MKTGYLKLFILIFCLWLVGCFPIDDDIGDVNTVIPSKPTVTQMRQGPENNSPTPVVSSTVEPMESLSPGNINSISNILIGPFILLDQFPGLSGYYLWDLGYGNVHEIIRGKTISYIYGWDKEGCEIVVNDVLDGIISIDLMGNKIKTIFDKDLYPNYVDYVTIEFGYPSPVDHKWVYYYLGRGALVDDYSKIDYEFKDLEIISSDGTNGPYRFTDNGGAKVSSWSNDGSQIAYSHAKDDGQIFVSVAFPDTSEIRSLWRLPRNSIINSIDWSPDGKYLLIHYEHKNNDSRELSIISDAGDEILKLDNVGQPEWWYDNNSVVVSYLLPSERVPGFGIIDITTGNIEKEIPFQTSHGYMIRPKSFPDNPNKIGFFISVDSTDFFIFDMLSGQYDNFSLKDTGYELDNWYPGPLSPCPNPPQ